MSDNSDEPRRGRSWWGIAAFVIGVAALALSSYQFFAEKSEKAEAQAAINAEAKQREVLERHIDDLVVKLKEVQDQAQRQEQVQRHDAEPSRQAPGSQQQPQQQCRLVLKVKGNNVCVQ